MPGEPKEAPFAPVAEEARAAALAAGAPAELPAGPLTFVLEISRAALVLTGPGSAAFVEQLKHLTSGLGEQTIRVREGVDLEIGGRGSTLRIEGRG